MRSATSRTITAMSVIGACLVWAPATAAHAATTPVETGCPAAYETFAVADLEAKGYRMPVLADGAGNHDGLVCGKPYVAQAAEQLCPACPVSVLCGFRDNDVTR